MNIGDLVTWKSNVLNNDLLEYGVVIDTYGNIERNNRYVWVKFTNGQHSHKQRTFCRVDHLMLVEDIKQKRT